MEKGGLWLEKVDHIFKERMVVSFYCEGWPGDSVEMHLSNERIINVHPGLKSNYWLLSILLDQIMSFPESRNNP